MHIDFLILEYAPPSTCSFDFGITEGLAALGLGAGATAGDVGLATAALEAPATAGAAGAATGLSAGALAAAPAVWTPATAAAAGAGLVAPSAIPLLSSVGTAAAGAGTLLSAKSALNQGQYQSDLAKAENDALTQKANQDAASGEQQEISRLRQSQLVLSRAQATAAASGTDATSPDILNTESQIVGQSQYNALSSLYEGQASARADQYQGQIDLFKGTQAAQAAPIAAAGTILSGLSSFATNRSLLRYYSKVGGVPSFGGS